MKRATFLMMILTMLLVGCHNDDEIEGVSECIRDEILNFADSPNNCNDASVAEYLFQDNLVYVFDPGTCGADMQSPVLDENCTVLGLLGGIIGNTQINGEDFSTATYLRTVW